MGMMTMVLSVQAGSECASASNRCSIKDMLRRVCLCLLIVLASFAIHADGVPMATAGVFAPSGGLPVADKIVVRKSERRMYLMKGANVLRVYPVHLGLRPVGHKEEEGDFRTPEGRYKVARRNARSDFFLSLQVSYPNDDDVARSQKARVSPGGAIMIHGLPNVPRKTLDYYNQTDWTDGCIAVSNSDMVEIWLMTALDMPIEILP